MLEFSDELYLDQARCIAQAMWKVAHADNHLHHKEADMVEEFYLQCCQDANLETKEETLGSWDSSVAKKVLNTQELHRVLIYSCYLIGFVDGEFSQEERDVILEIQKDLDIDEKLLSEEAHSVLLSLFQSFEGVNYFKDDVYEIGKQFGLSESAVDNILVEVRNLESEKHLES